MQTPRARHEAVNKKLIEKGWRQLESDPCVWILAKPRISGGPDEVIAMAASHVYDFLFAGLDEDPQ